MGYVIGQNMPGYLPNDDSEPYIYDTADAAKRGLIYLMDRDADAADSLEGPCQLGNEIAAAMEDLNLTDCTGGYSVVVYDPEREHDLGTCYWIEIYQGE